MDKQGACWSDRQRHRRRRDEPWPQRREGPGPEAEPEPVAASAAAAGRAERRGVVGRGVVVVAELVPVVGGRAGAGPRAAVVRQPRGDAHGAGGLPALPHVRHAVRDGPALPSLPQPRPPRLPPPRRRRQQRSRRRRKEQEGSVMTGGGERPESRAIYEQVLVVLLD